MRWSVRVIVLVLSVGFMESACTVSKPEIVEVFSQLNHRFDVQTNTKSEELVFFGHIVDGDGEDDIESIFLVSDSTDLYWRLQADSWEQITLNEETWIGSSEIGAFRHGSIPRGTFRVIVVDRAGETAESSIYLSSDQTTPEETEYPTLSVRNEEIEISSPSERSSIWFYDGSGSVVKRISTTSRVVPLKGVLSNRERQRVVSAAVFAYDNDTGIGAISGVYAIE